MIDGDLFVKKKVTEINWNTEVFCIVGIVSDKVIYTSDGQTFYCMRKKYFNKKYKRIENESKICKV